MHKRTPSGVADKKYSHPIPSREAIVAFMEQAGTPVSLHQICDGLDTHGKKHQQALEKRLRAMVRDGQLIRNRSRRYCLTDHLDLVAGTVSAHRDGYGFLIRDDGLEDVYLSAREMWTLWDGDRVAVRTSDGRRGLEGHVVEVLERAKAEIVGTLRTERGIDFVREQGDSKAEILIGRGKRHGAKPGDIVRADIIEHASGRSHALGEVVEIVGRPDMPGIETDVALLAHGIPHEWSDALREELEPIPERVTAAARRGREDLRDTPLVTIDGADARDFDDAVYCERHGEGWRLLVAIADVSHYVKSATALDQEARARGTSVYFPDRVVPMLPEKLSNGICSLNPKVDRLCLICDMLITRRGVVSKSRFYNAVIRSHARLTYRRAWSILSDIKVQRREQRLAEILKPLQEVHRAFAGARRRRGAIDFDLPETVILLGDNGQVADVHPRERLETHRIIEECMIAANVEAAKRIRQARIPSLYRVHGGPDLDKLDELFLFLATFGLQLPAPNNVQPKDLSRIIQQLAGRPEADLVQTMILRSMNQALYQPKNIGHFGLSLPRYAHFTSPIRRYPDLLVHRAIKWLIDHGTFKGFGYTIADMTALGESCSRAERRADEAVWDVEEQLKCRFMRERVGESFDAVVSSVMSFGAFVRIPRFAVDGLVHVSTLPRDYYHREPSGTALVGERTGKRITLMDRVRVRLMGVNLEERKIDFVLEEDEPPRRRRRRHG
jgi:ribonuclease R